MSAVERPAESRAGIYVHIPFCARKCVYCSFNSRETAGSVPAAYIDALVCDVQRSAGDWSGIEFGSVYIGGGTPSLLEAGGLERVLGVLRGRLRVSPGAEITLEANPSSLAPNKLISYRDCGINRLSIGVQSLDARELGSLGRLHSPAEALRAVAEAREAGFDNIGADVILGIPGQTPSSLAATLSELAPLVDHISCYLLSVDAGTPLDGLVRRGGVREQAESDVVLLCETAERRLAGAGFARYEISNWARAGRESRHNLLYWARGSYLGVGAGASSHRSGARWRKTENPDSYSEVALSGGDPVCFSEILSADDELAEEVMLGLRTTRGLDLRRLASRYGCNLKRVDVLLERLSDGGLIVRKRTEVQLSPKGMLVSDALIADLTAALAPS